MNFDKTEAAGPLDLGFLWQRHVWIEFVVCSLVFLQVLPVFPSPKKPTIPNSNSIRTRLNELLRTPMCFAGKQITITITYHEGVSEERDEYDPLDVRRLSRRLCF